MRWLLEFGLALLWFIEAGFMGVRAHELAHNGRMLRARIVWFVAEMLIFAAMLTFVHFMLEGLKRVFT